MFSCILQLFFSKLHAKKGSNFKVIGTYPRRRLDGTITSCLLLEQYYTLRVNHKSHSFWPFLLDDVASWLVCYNSPFPPRKFGRQTKPKLHILLWNSWWTKLKASTFNLRKHKRINVQRELIMKWRGSTTTCLRCAETKGASSIGTEDIPITPDIILLRLHQFSQNINPFALHDLTSNSSKTSWPPGSISSSNSSQIYLSSSFSILLETPRSCLVFPVAYTPYTSPWTCWVNGKFTAADAFSQKVWENRGSVRI